MKDSLFSVLDLVLILLLADDEICNIMNNSKYSLGLTLQQKNMYNDTSSLEYSSENV